MRLTDPREPFMENSNTPLNPPAWCEMNTVPVIEQADGSTNHVGSPLPTITHILHSFFPFQTRKVCCDLTEGYGMILVLGLPPRSRQHDYRSQDGMMTDSCKNTDEKMKNKKKGPRPTTSPMNTTNNIYTDIYRTSYNTMPLVFTWALRCQAW